MKLLPYFKWYPADAETDENYASLNDEELGFFHRCLNKSWINGGLPGDMNKLASMMRVSRKTLDRHWMAVSRCFIMTDDVHPRFVNRRQEEEREAALSKSKSASNSVRTRYVRSTNDLPRAYDYVSVSKELKEETTLPEIQTQHDYPQTLAVIREHDSAADAFFCVKLADAVARAIVSHPVASEWNPAKQQKALTDAVLARVCRESYETPGRKKNHGTGLLLMTVPNIVIGGKLNYV